MGIEIDDIRRLVVRPGESIVVKVSSCVSQAQLEGLARVFAEKLPTGVNVIVIDPTVCIDIVTSIEGSAVVDGESDPDAGGFAARLA